MQKQVLTLSQRSYRSVPLAVAILLVLGHNAPIVAAPTSTVVVQNCKDSGTGSMRAAVSGAASGSEIDLSQLSCTTISLTTGSIQISQTDLSFNGPGATKLTIDGGLSASHYNRIFHHTGTGDLSIYGLTLTDAKYKPSAAEATGGCVYSEGTVLISGSVISGCSAVATGNFDAKGGAIFAEKGLELSNSSVTGNTAFASGAGYASGGGIYLTGDMTIKYSSISNNYAAAGTTDKAGGGGIEMFQGDVTMLSSTVANNYSSGSDAGMLLGHFNGDPSNTAEIINSTISSNSAQDGIGGIRNQIPLTLANSTVVFNDSGTFNGFGSGIQLQGSLNLQSTIIAENFGSGGDNDLYTGSQTVTGANNLITETTGTTAVPADTITACPLLGRLADNGGPTLTHRLLPNSPALDKGNNNTGFGGNPLSYDQRGSGHPRTYNGVTDIGSFEYAGGVADEIFRSEFESRCR